MLKDSKKAYGAMARNELFTYPFTVVEDHLPRYFQELKEPGVVAPRIMVIDESRPPSWLHRVGQFTLEIPVDVWIDINTGIYHLPGSRRYGRTKNGCHMTLPEAVERDYRRSEAKLEGVDQGKLVFWKMLSNRIDWDSTQSELRSRLVEQLYSLLSREVLR